MIKIYLVLLIGIVLALTETRAKFYDIVYNQEYVVNITDFGDYLPENFQYFFRLSIEEVDKIQIQLKVFKNETIKFNVDVCGFETYPKNFSDFFFNLDCYPLENKIGRSDDKYDMYLYDFKIRVNIHYLGIRIQNLLALHYLSVYVYSAKGSYLALILILIFLPCIIIAAIVIFCLRKYGIINLGVSSNKI